jgi:uncharacterized protein (DUF1778 family)
MTSSGGYGTLKMSEITLGASHMPLAETRNEKLDLRLTASAKRTLQLAAASKGQSLTEFVLESALQRADETMPDRQHFGLNAEQWAVFHKALDAPTKPSPRMEKLLREPSVFERETE